MRYPKYRCHKVVEAVKLLKIEHAAGSVRLTPADASFPPVYVDYDDPLTDRLPSVLGNREHDYGYLVVYPDGFRSWSPTEAFEDGYAAL